MILPKDVKGKEGLRGTKIRNARIIQLYLSDSSMTTNLLAEKFKLSQSRIMQILKANARLVLEEKDWNKLQRLNLLKADLSKPEFQSQTLSKKDLLELWRKEFDGDESNQKEIRITNIIRYAEPGCTRESILESTSRGTTSDNQII